MMEQQPMPEQQPTAPPAYTYPAAPPPGQGYPQQQAGYPSQQAGYPQQQAGYPSQQAGYPQQQAGYPSQQAGYPQQQAGYPSQQGGAYQEAQQQQYQQYQGYPPPQAPPQASQFVQTGTSIEQYGGSCLDCLSGPPGVPSSHPLGGFSCDECVQGWCICCGFGQVQYFNSESVDASPCNVGLCYFFPYIGGLLGFAMHYPLRQRLESKLVTGSHVGAVPNCPVVDACCVFCFPACHMCQALRSIRGYKYAAERHADTSPLMGK